jgi:acyl-CoA thioesterase FadM
VSVSCDYVAAVRFGDEVDIVVSVAAVGRASVTYEFQFAQAGRPVANGRVVAVWCLMRAGGRPEAAAIPPDIVARLTGAG